MSEHLPESLIGSEVPAWCKVCKKETRHRVDRVAVGSHAGKAGPCMEHGPKQKPERKPEDHASTAGRERVGGLLATKQRAAAERTPHNGLRQRPRRANLLREQTARHRHAVAAARCQLRKDTAMMPDKRFAAGWALIEELQKSPFRWHVRFIVGHRFRSPRAPRRVLASTRRTSSRRSRVAMITHS